jgi:uncharacterized membrane protein
MPPASSNRGLMIVLAYLWPLAIVPLVVENEDSEVRWHAKNGLVLMIAELIVLLAFTMMTSLISIATFGVGCVLSIFVVFIWIAILAVHVIAIVKGINGTRLIVPGISEYANRF